MPSLKTLPETLKHMKHCLDILTTTAFNLGKSSQTEIYLFIFFSPFVSALTFLITIILNDTLSCIHSLGH